MVALHLVPLDLVLRLDLALLLDQNRSIAHLPKAADLHLFVAIPQPSPTIRAALAHALLTRSLEGIAIRGDARHTLVNKHNQEFLHTPVELVSAANIHKPLWRRR